MTRVLTCLFFLTHRSPERPKPARLYYILAVFWYHSGDIPKHPNQEELVWQITQARRREARLLYQRFRQEEEWQKMDEYRDMYNEYEALIEIFLEDEYIELEEELRLLGWHYFEVEEEFWD